MHARIESVGECQCSNLLSLSRYSTQTYHILPRCCTLPLDGKKVRLELYTDNGACSSSGALAVDTVAERDGIAIVYDFTFAGSFDFAKKLVQDIEEWRKHSNVCWDVETRPEYKISVCLSSLSHPSIPLPLLSYSLSLPLLSSSPPSHSLVMYGFICLRTEEYASHSSRSGWSHRQVQESGVQHSSAVCRATQCSSHGSELEFRGGH